MLLRWNAVTVQTGFSRLFQLHLLFLGAKDYILSLIAASVMVQALGVVWLCVNWATMGKQPAIVTNHNCVISTGKRAGL